MRDKSVLRAADLSSAVWSKSDLSGGGGTSDCVEVTRVMNDGVVIGYALRDSTDPDGPKLFFWPSEYDKYTRSVRDGQENLLPVQN